MTGGEPLFAAAPDALTATPGAYVLLVELPEPLQFDFAGGSARLAPGFYLYCGSARGPGGLAARIARHMRRAKKIRWHIDRLTTAGVTHGAWIFPDGDECALARRCESLPTPLPGFGASDCPTCRSHLFLASSGEFAELFGKHPTRQQPPSNRKRLKI